MQGFSHYFENQSKLLIQKANSLKTRSQRQFAYRAVVLTIYGFQVTIPVLLGLFIGYTLDKHYPVNHISWILNMILIGAFVGFYNANIWFYKTIGLHKTKGRKK